MGSSGKSPGYELVPCTMVLPAMPLPSKQALDARRRTGRLGLPSPGACSTHSEIRGAVTLSTSYDDAQARMQVLLGACQRRVRGGDPSALADLLEEHPDFIRIPWVRETLARLQESGRVRRRRGRPSGRFTFHPLVVAGLVRELVSSGRAANPERAFQWLEIEGVMSSYRAKDLYYQARRDERFRAILLTFEEHAITVSETEARRLMANRQFVGRGSQATAKVEHPIFGEVTVTIGPR